MAEQAGAAKKAQMANVRYGVYGQPGPHVGKTVKQVREEHAKLWGIPADAQAFNGKTKLSDDHVIEAGENIEFHRKQGEKG